MKRDIVHVVLLADIRRRQTRSRQELAELTAAEQLLQTTPDYEQQAFKRIRSEVNLTPLPIEEIHNKSQREILHLIAERNDGWLVVQPAIKLMIEAGVLSEGTASAQVYTVLALAQKKREFARVTAGIYVTKTLLALFRRPL